MRVFIMEKRFANENFPPEIQERADRMNTDESMVPAVELPPLPISDHTSGTEFQTKIRPRLIAAFEKDEEYAVSAMKDMPKGRKSAMKVNFTFTFQQDNEKSMYSLSTNENGKIDLSINVRRGDSTGRDVSLNWDLETDKWSKDLDGLVDELGCIVSNSIQLDEKNNRLILEGDVYIDGKKIKQGNYEKNGREVIVQ